MAIDDLSERLGRLDAVLDEVSRQCRALFQKSDESTAQLHTVAAVKAANPKP